MGYFFIDDNYSYLFQVEMMIESVLIMLGLLEVK